MENALGERSRLNDCLVCELREGMPVTCCWASDDRVKDQRVAEAHGILSAAMRQTSTLTQFVRDVIGRLHQPDSMIGAAEILKAVATFAGELDTLARVVEQNGSNP